MTKVVLPILFSIGPIHLYTYGLFIAIAFLSSTFLIWKYSRELELDEELIFDVVLIGLFLGLLGARLYYVLLHPSDFTVNLIRIIHLTKFPGLVFHGGLITGFAATVVFLLKKMRACFWQALEIIVLGFSLAQGIGRLGCFFNGCCFGIKTKLFWGVNFPGLAGKRHPVQLFEAFFDFLIFWLLLLIYRNNLNRVKEKKGEIVFIYFILSSLTRFTLEFLRGDSVYWQGFRLAQVVSGVIFGIALTTALIRYKSEIKVWIVSKIINLKTKRKAKIK